MNYYLCFCFFLSFAYFFINLRYYYHWAKIPVFVPKDDFQPTAAIDIIIVARDEAEHILALLESVKAQNYPLDSYKITLVDDHSEDETLNLANNFFAKNPQLQAQILQLCDAPNLQKNSQSFKKIALDYALQQTENELIICTDADCVLGENWLYNYAAAWEETGAVFLSAGLILNGENTLLQRFQQLDNVGMMAITAAGGKIGHFLANGGNMGYSRQIYTEMGAYSQNLRYASGDDMFLVAKVGKSYPKQLFFIKNQPATVQTEVKKTLAGFYQQRLRWASKSKGYQSVFLLTTLLTVWLSTVFILVNLVLSPFFARIWLILALQIGLKMIADWVLLASAARFFGQQFLLKHFVGCFFAHIFYITIIGFMANLAKKYEWKGRKVS